MRRLRGWWHRLRGWWLLVVAAAATAVLSAVGNEDTGVAAAIAVAVGGVVAAVLSERGRAQLFELAETAAKPGSPLYVSRVDRISDPIRPPGSKRRNTNDPPVCAGHGVAVDLRAPYSDDADQTF